MSAAPHYGRTAVLARSRGRGGRRYVNLFARGFLSSAWFIGFSFEHHWSRSGNSSVFSHSPKVHDHEYRGDDGDSDAVPDVGAEQGICIHDRAAQQSKSDIVIRRHVQQWAERSFVAQQRRGAGHVRAYGDSPESELIVR